MVRMKLHRPRSPTLAAVLAGVARLAALTAAVADSALEGLASPRGLTALDDGRLLIAEVGGGRLLILDRQNRLPVLHGGLPRLKDGPEGVPAGVSAAVQLGGITYYVVGEARAKEFPEVYALAPGDHPVGLIAQDPLGLAPSIPSPTPTTCCPPPLADCSSATLEPTRSGASPSLARSTPTLDWTLRPTPRLTAPRRRWRAPCPPALLRDR